MTAPKKFYISPLWLPLFKDSDVNMTRVKQNRMDDTDIKYLSEDHVNSLLAEKDKEIKSLQENEDLLRNRKNEHIELLKSEIESKDKEIENLKTNLFNCLSKHNNDNSKLIEGIINEVNKFKQP